MAYKLEHSNEEQRSLLSSTVQKWSNSQPDMYMISIEGHKIYTQRILLGLYSSLMDGLLSIPGLGDLPGVCVPASSGCLVNLLKILTSGVAIANNKAHLLEATKAAEVIGIKLDNCQIGMKKKKPDAAKPVVAKTAVKVNRPATPTDRKRKAQTQTLPNKAKVKVPVITHVKEEVEDQEEFNDLLLNGADVILKEGDGNQDGIIEGNSASLKKLKCSQCDKDFKSKQALKRHFQIHTDNPTPFGCDYCKKKYDRKYLLDNHTIKKHNIKTANDELPEKEDDGDDVNNFDENETEDQSNLDEIREVEEKGNTDQKHDDLENLELDENIIQDEEGMKLEENNEAAVENEDSIAVNETPDVSDDLVKDHEKLLSDRKKLLAELSNMEDDSQGDLDFLNGD
eukprot:GFUD01027177.1.p1 GENE.GFUD01027177.1~~GFUD01027177.1.p1  ORF type:complete len:397 (+),score=112.72 GFUD01027177.1:61-1251(+)